MEDIQLTEVMSQRKMGDMTKKHRDFDATEELRAASLEEIRGAWDAVITRLRARKVKFGAQRIKTLHALNALALWYIHQSDGVQERIAQEGLIVLGRHKKSLTPIPIKRRSVAKDIYLGIAGTDTENDNSHPRGNNHAVDLADSPPRRK